MTRFANETFDWLKPSPLWAEDGSDVAGGDLFRPRLLRFDSDSFMDEFFAAAGAASPQPLAGAVAVADGPVLRVYQPAHGSYYLVCASLCCRQAGFPDRQLRRTDGDKASFVLRKLADAPAGGEFAWAGAGKAKKWAAVSPGNGLAPDEERLPLMRTPAGNGRTLFFGYVPAAVRETYAAARTDFVDPAVPATQKDLRTQEFGSRFTGSFLPPGKTHDGTGYVGDPLLQVVKLDPDPDPTSTTATFTRRTVSVYVLLEAVEFFKDNVPAVYDALSAPGPISTPPGPAGDLLKVLQDQPVTASASLADLLRKVAQNRDALDADGGMGRAAFDAAFDSDFDLARFVAGADPGAPDDDPSAATLTGMAKRLNAAVAAALTPLPADGPSGFRLPRSQPADRYVLRLAYERTGCVPAQAYVSRPSVPFELAGYYDPDAPARKILIPLPADVSIAGLRKMKKNVSFLMSDAMRKKMSRVAGKESKMLGDPPEAGDESDGGFAFICSFSLQIIFIIAFMLLLIFVIVFNIIFWWIFFFKICFPVPKKWLK